MRTATTSSSTTRCGSTISSGPTCTTGKQVLGEDADAFGHAETAHVLTLHYLVNDILMAFFFAIAAKEVWEAVILKNGSLRGKKAATPLFATAGGMFGPIAVYLGLAAFLGLGHLRRGRKRLGHPDGHGHRVLLSRGPAGVRGGAPGGSVSAAAGHRGRRGGPDHPRGILSVRATSRRSGCCCRCSRRSAVFVLFNWLPRKLDAGDQLRPRSTWMRHKLSFWPYLIAGCLSWYGFAQSGLHPALGLLPIVPTLPHADRAFGIFSEAEQYLTDLLNHTEHLLKHPVEIVLFFFGLLNAGVEFSSISEPTWLVLAGLIIGKPLGVLLFGYIGAHVLKLGLPEGMRTVDLFVVGCVAAIGFTVSLFVASVAFDPGPVQDAAKMGALFSFAAAGISLLVGKLAGCRSARPDVGQPPRFRHIRRAGSCDPGRITIL